MYKHLLKQTAKHKIVDGTNEYSEPNITKIKDIKCRIEYKNVQITNAQGQQVVSKARLFTEAVVNIGDLIFTQNKDYPVIQSGPKVDFDGNVLIYEIYF